MKLSRRRFVQNASMAAAASQVGSLGSIPLQAAPIPASLTKQAIIDTHQHLWDFTTVKPSWLAGANAVLNRPMHHAEYREATKGLNVEAIYMEVDVDDDQLQTEAKHVLDLCNKPTPTIAAVLGGRPDSETFTTYVASLRGVRGNPKLKGFRRVLHTDKTPPGYCLQEGFVKGIRELGKRKLMFDLCLRPTDLGDGLRLAKLCPETRFMLDHCGNADPLAFRQQGKRKEGLHSAESWKKDIEALAGCSNLYCKISGIIARLPEGGDANDLAPIVNHCLDSFGADRVVFGSDWPVCLLGAPLLKWVEYLSQIIASRSQADQDKLWSINATKIYDLTA